MIRGFALKVANQAEAPTGKALTILPRVKACVLLAIPPRLFKVSSSYVRNVS